MFNEVLAQYADLAQHISDGLRSFALYFFIALAVLEISIIAGKTVLSMQSGDKMVMSLSKAVLYIAFASALGGYFLQEWFPAAWEQVYKLAYNISGTSADYSPSSLVDLLFQISGSILDAAIDQGSVWNGTIFGYTLMAVGIIFICIIIFAIIISMIAVNYVTWSILTAMGAIFVCFFVMNISRPIFSNYIKYLVGLLLKTLTQLILLGILVISIQDMLSYKDKLGPEPKKPNCEQLDQADAEILQQCTSNQYFSPIERTQCVANVKASWNYERITEQCESEKKVIALYHSSAKKGFIYRGILLVVTMILFLVIFMTIPDIVAGMVGFGDYSVKGISQAMGAVAMGWAGAKSVSKSVGSSATGVASGAKSGNGVVGTLGGAVGGGLAGMVGGKSAINLGSTVGSTLGSASAGLAKTGGQATLATAKAGVQTGKSIMDTLKSTVK
ncbi:type IV secretion system protein [Francisella philomiragia]|uniref:type IV secretion system protein n=1 Tax=Francisella philomiragia TaxID=28110 RepID=UPI001903BB9E|nr:type IV secretion system protein [Francisella philomiragia]MBK2341731.1 type IV secretion system protein [Francisella philomiragia]